MLEVEREESNLTKTFVRNKDTVETENERMETWKRGWIRGRRTRNGEAVGTHNLGKLISF
jgi:hypothetical protein